MYNIGNRFVITKENDCLWDIDTVVKIIDIDEADKVYRYQVVPIDNRYDDFWLCSNEEINNWNYDEQEWNIDNFARLIESGECEECTECANEKCNNERDFTTYGEMHIVGRCYEDVVSILMANGYIVQVEKNDIDDFNKATFNIIYGVKEN